MRAFGLATELQTRQESQIIAKPLETPRFRKITWLHLRPLAGVSTLA